MISYAELDRERTFPFFLTRNLISGKKAIRWRKCYLPEWFHVCHYHLPPPPNIHTDWEQSKIIFLRRILLLLLKTTTRWGKPGLQNQTNESPTHWPGTLLAMGSRTSRFLLTRSYSSEKEWSDAVIDVRRWMWGSTWKTRTKPCSAEGKRCPSAVSPAQCQIPVQLPSHRLWRLLSVCPLFETTGLNIKTCMWYFTYAP